MAAAATRSRSVTETVNGSHKFVIEGYSLTKGMGVGKHVCSDKFSVGGHRWAIYFYPDGKNPDGNSAYVSVFVALAGDGTDVRALFELTLLDQSGKGNHKVHSHFAAGLHRGPHILRCRGSMWGYKRFFRKTLLETSDYLKDDSLKINCTVGVVVSAVNCPLFHSITVPESDTGSDFGTLLDDTESSDITLDVSGEKFQAHKLVLAARSLIFRSKFLDGLEDNEAEVKVTDIEPKVFKAMLHFIYRDSLAEDVDRQTARSSKISLDSMTAKLLAAADMYGLDRLKLICQSRLCKDVSVKSVVEILVLADRCNASELKAVCLEFAAENLSGVMQTKGFKHLEENCSSLQSELLRTIAGFNDSRTVGPEMSQSVWAQLDGDDANVRRVKQKLDG